MASIGTRKAAMLLMSLDPSTAAELLRGAEPATVTQIAAELAYLQKSGAPADAGGARPVEEFYEQLRQKLTGGGDRFVQTMLEGVLGPDRAREVMTRIPQLVEARDPFFPIRSAEPKDLADALGGESPQVVGLVLGELPSKTSAKLLPLLEEAVRTDAVRGLASGRQASSETRLRVASMIRRKLSGAAAGPAGPAGTGRVAREKHLRKVAIMLREIAPEMRQTLVGAVTESDPDAGAAVQRLMVIWDDLASVADRSLQEALRGIDSRKLAIALVGADQTTVDKIRQNISERQAAMLDEEISLLATPKEEETEEARNEVLGLLRELAGRGALAFEE